MWNAIAGTNIFDRSPRSTDKRCVVAVGEFDGMHLGHQQVITTATRLASLEKLPLFAVVVDDKSKASICQPIPERCVSVMRAGASGVGSMEVDSLGEAAEDVARRVIQLDPACVVVACRRDHSPVSPFGEALRRLGAQVVYHDLTAEVSSHRVRSAIHNGDLLAARMMLGRPIEVAGRVVHGRGLGRTIGFATANLDLSSRQILPPLGVYAAEVVRPRGQRHLAAVNIGVRPTIESDGAELVEAHLLDFDDDLYGARIVVRLHECLRAEHRFESVDALTEQLATDVEAVRTVMRSRPNR